MEKIKLSLEGKISYKAEVDEVQALQIIRLCIPALSSATTKDKTATSIPESPPMGLNSLAVREFLDQYSPKYNTAKIVVFAAYLKEYRQKDSFLPVEIRNLFREAHEGLPGNFSRDFREAVSAAWIAEDPSKKGSFFITATGLRAMETGFSRKVKRKKAGHNSNKK